MALGDLMASRLGHSSPSSPSPSPAAAASAAPVPPPLPHQHQHHQNHLPVANGPTTEPRNGLELVVAEAVEKPAPPVPFLPQVVVLCEQRHQGIDEATAAAAAPSTTGLVSKWRPKDRMLFLVLALMLC